MTPKTTALMFSSKTDEWATPQDFFDRCAKRFGPFDLDACATAENKKVESYYDKEVNGLAMPWHNGNHSEKLTQSGVTVSDFVYGGPRRCWMNPPYGEPEHPCKPKCKKKRCLPPSEEHPERRGHHITEYIPGVCDWVKKAYEESQKGCLVVCLLPARTDTRWFHDYCVKGEVEFIKGRLKFGGAKNAAPFPSMVVVFRPKESACDELAGSLPRPEGVLPNEA